MNSERYFLGWDRPALHLIVDFLWKEFSRAATWDMSAVLLVLPGARAGRRLLELLAWKAGQAQSEGQFVTLLPPRIVTAGSLPERLYSPALRPATELESLLARVHVLRTAPPETVKGIFALPPDDTDFMGWLNLAAELDALDRELAAEELTYTAVAQHCAGKTLQDSVRRWNTLDDLQQRYAAALSAVDRVSRYQAHRNAIDKNELHQGLTVVLAATVDLPTLTCRLLEASESRVVALVHAPEAQAAGFDEFGRLHPAHWAHAAIPVEDSEIYIVDHPRDQANALLDFLDRLPGVPEEHIIVGLGDESLAPAVERAIELSGRGARRAVNMTVADSPPAQLLSFLSAYYTDKAAADFAALIRHPDLNDWLTSTAGEGVEIGGWASACDDYRTRRLPITIEAGSASMPAALVRATAAVAGLLPPPGRQALSAWAVPLSELLATVYGGQAYAEGIPDQRRIVRSLALLGAALQSFSELPENHPHNPQLGFTEAVGFLLSQAGSQPIPEEGDDAPIELLGWLEVHLDDAPALVVTGFNEGFIPDSVNAAPLLPDSLRHELGLTDNRRRYARDAYLLSAMKCSRQALALVCGRLTAKNDPLAPSRLLFAADDDAVVRRTLEFYGEPAPPAARPPLLTHGKAYSLAAIPRPLALAGPLNELSVTAFRDYLACPYRFYLKHICKLRTVDDDLEEMGGDIFGSIAHRIFSRFGEWVMADYNGYPPTDVALIEAQLEALLDTESQYVLGTPLLTAVEIQLHQLHRRLKAFACHQADEAAEGWQIVHIEKDLERWLPHSGGEFRVHGRVDRIDYHPDYGYRVLDYKTGDGGTSPEKNHCRGRKGEVKTWHDLQLPLYRRIAPCLGLKEDEVSVGYVLLPKDTENVGIKIAGWAAEDFDAAYEVADAVIDKLRAEIFWPPSENTPRYADGLEGICLDRSMDRNSLIEAKNAPPLYWPHLRPEAGWQSWPGQEVRDDR